MKVICKSPEPEDLTTYRKRFRTQFRRWPQLKQNQTTLKAIRQTLNTDQKGLCAYCEISLHEKDRAVEHFIPCKESIQEKNHDLDWQNMLATCQGGLQNIDIPGEEALRNSKPPHNIPCCGAAKADYVPDGRLLNPLNLPTTRLFKFSSQDGEIRPDELACEHAGIDVEYVQFTIQTLGLNVPRLKDQRLAVMEEVYSDLDAQDDGGIDAVELEKKVAADYLGNGMAEWPCCFTTLRWVLKDGAEEHLRAISYKG